MCTTYYGDSSLNVPVARATDFRTDLDSDVPGIPGLQPSPSPSSVSASETSSVTSGSPPSASFIDLDHVTSTLKRASVGNAATDRSMIDLVVLLGDPRLTCREKLTGHYNQDDIDTVNKMKEVVTLFGYRSVTFIDDHTDYFRKLTSLNVHTTLVLNLCDEGYWNDARKELHVPALLELLHLQYTGAGPVCLGVCYDKQLVNNTARAIGVAVPYEVYLSKNQPITDDQMAMITYPAFIKPARGDNSIGITAGSVVYGPEALRAYVRHLFDDLNMPIVLVQEYLQGEEYTVGMIGNSPDDFWYMPILHVDYSSLDKNLPRILAYESKWDSQSKYCQQVRYKKAENLPIDAVRRFYDYANKLFERFECRDYARFDFRMDSNGNIKLLEVNPNPGWCWDGKFAMMAAMAGESYSQMLLRITDAAVRRTKGH